ncbi:MAG TPA: hypothetical protein VNM45_18785 [Bacillus sp. (in: firmicutes)]|nr:hypothetical protein [Bacillus sp. (in: firmicutes)]
MGFISMLILIALVYFLIVKPMTRRNRRHDYYGNDHRYEDDRGYNDGRQYAGGRGYGPDYRREYGPGGYYGPRGMGMGGGLGGIGTFAGGIAAGALLSQLFDQGRISLNEYQHLQQLEDHEAIQQLMDQNILQEQEINDLQEQAGFDHNDDYAVDDQDYGDGGGFEDFGGEDDNWV